MKRQITNLLVLPLIASAVLLSSPALAASPNQRTQSEIRHKTSIESGWKKGIAGTVLSISGAIVIVKTANNMEYTVDTSNATIMKSAEEPSGNPAIVSVGDIHVGDFIVVRGEIKDTEVEASSVFDGKMSHHKHHHRGSRKHH